MQGSGKTPLGTHRLPWAFGMNAERDRWDDSYRRVRNGDYWVLDNQSAYYNRYRNKSQGGFRWRLPSSHPDGSERLKDFPSQYEFVVRDQLQRRARSGTAAVRSSSTSTAAAPRPAACRRRARFMRRLMVHLHQDRVPVIAIGR